MQTVIKKLLVILYTMSSIDKEKINSTSMLESESTKDSLQESKILKNAKANYPKSYEEEAKKFLSKYNLPIETLALEKLTGVFDLANNENLNRSEHRDDKELIKTSEGKELIAMRKMQFLIGKIDSFCEENKIKDPKDLSILLDFFLEENKGNINQLEEAIIDGGGEKIKSSIDEKRQIIQWYKDLINNPDTDEKKILEFNNKEGDHILGNIFLMYGVTGISENQADKIEKSEESDSLSTKQEQNENNLKAIEYLAKVREAKTVQRRKEIELKKQQAESQWDKASIEWLSKELDKLLQEQKEFNILIISKRKEYQDNIEEIKAELKKEVAVETGIDPLQDLWMISWLKSIKIDRNTNLPKIESSDLPDFLPREGKELQKFPNPIKKLPLFQSNPNGEDLSRQLLLFQFFQWLKGKYSSEKLSDQQRGDIIAMQGKWRVIPFWPDDMDKESKINKRCDTIRKTVGPHIQKGLIDPIKPYILERSNKELVWPIEDADKSILSWSLDRKEAHYDTNWNISIPNKFITPFSTSLVNNTSLEVKNGEILYPQITWGEANSNSPLLWGTTKIGNTRSIWDLIHDNAWTINKDLLHKVLKSKNPQQMLLAEYSKNSSNNNPIDSEKLWSEIALSGSQHLVINMLWGGHKSHENLQNMTEEKWPLDWAIKAILWKDDEKEWLQWDNIIYKDIQSILSNMKWRDTAMHNRFSRAISTLSEVLKNPETEKNIWNIIASSEDSNNHKLAYIGSLSQWSRKENSLLPFIQLFREGEKWDFNGEKFCNTVDELDFAINQWWGAYSFTHEPQKNKAEEIITKNKRMKDDKDLEDALQQIDNSKLEE